MPAETIKSSKSLSFRVLIQSSAPSIKTKKEPTLTAVFARHPQVPLRLPIPRQDRLPAMTNRPLALPIFSKLTPRLKAPPSILRLLQCPTINISSPTAIAKATSALALNLIMVFPRELLPIPFIAFLPIPLIILRLGPAMAACREIGGTR